MAMTDRIKRLVFFNAVDEVDTYVRTNGSLSFGDTLCVTMSPSVYDYVLQKGGLARATTDFFSNESHKHALKKSKEIMDWFRSNTSFSSLGIGDKEDAYRDSFIFYSRLVFMYCLWATEVVTEAIERHQPEVVAVSVSGRRGVSSIAILPEEKILGGIVRLAAKNKNILLEDFSKGARNKDGVALGKKLSVAAWFMLRLERFRFWQGAMVLIRLLSRQKMVFFTTKRYNMELLRRDIKSAFKESAFFVIERQPVLYLRMSPVIIRLLSRCGSDLIAIQQNNFDNMLEAMGKAQDVFSYKGICFHEIAAGKMRQNTIPCIIGLYVWAGTLSSFLSFVRPDAVITNGNRSDDVLLAQMCRDRGITTAIIPHGSHVRPKDEYEAIEGLENARHILNGPFSFLLTQSPLAEGYLEMFPSESRVVKTGPLIWGRPLCREAGRATFESIFGAEHAYGETKVVLHAGTPVATRSLRLHLYETPDEYIDALRELAAAVEGLPNTVLVIRFRPSPEITVQSLKRLVPFSGKVVLNVDGKFSDFLSMADLLVSFSSTTIEEALQNSVPVLLYGGRGRYQHVPAYEITPQGIVKKVAIYHVKEHGALAYALKGILDQVQEIKRDSSIFAPYRYSLPERASLADFIKQEISK